jgi:ABC-2 type transport system permease protein
MRPLITTIAFAGKEIRQVLRQPKLMAALILGPFIILALFAIGFETIAPTLRTIVVVPESSTLEIDVEGINEDLGGRLEITDVIPDEQAAADLLVEGEVDLVVVVPAEAEDTVRAGEEAVVTVLHDRLDPFDRAAIDVTAEAAVSDFNRSILAGVAAAAQERAGRLQEVIPEARQSASALADALETGDEEAATTARADTLEALDAIEREFRGTSDFMQAIDQGEEGDDSSIAENLEAARSSLDDTEGSDQSAAGVEELEANLSDLEAAVAEFRSVPPDVLVQPFVAETRAVSGTDVPVTIYYSPAVVLVLLQHVVLTFAALSLVSERSLGTTELFRVSPIGTTEVLIGKLLGYAFLGVIVGALLAVVVVFVFGTTMVGSWAWLAVVLGLTMAASLGLGFVIAAAATTDAQAVQYAMLALLFTIFFSGLVVSLERLSEGVRQLAFLAPATAGTAALHDVMFRGQAPRTWLLLVLGGYAVLTIILARWWLGRQRIA